ncbi:unnamed protein product [Effrenium voratum]|nr:unnamed protein product [Effrenium voratum]
MQAMHPMDASKVAAIAEIAEGIQDEMLAAMSSHMRNAAAACAEVCAARLNMLQNALSRNLDEARRHAISASPLTSNLATAQQVLTAAADTKRAALARQIRTKLEAQGETATSFLRTRSIAANQGLVSRDEFVACIASLGLPISHAEILDLFAFAVGSTERDTAVLEEVTQVLDAALPHLAPVGGSSGPVNLSPEAERVVGRVRSAVGRSGRPFEEVFRGFCRAGGRGASTMTRADLARVLSTFDPDIDPEVVARLWRLSVPESATGLDFSSFCSWFCPGGRALAGHGGHPHTPTGLSESHMLSQLLERSMPRSPGNLPSPLSASMPNLCHLDQPLPVSPAARATTLTPEQLLSNEFRQAPRNAWPTWPALQAGCVQPPPLSSLSSQEDFPAMACLSRLHGYLALKGLTLNFAFVLYDTHMEQAVTREGFVSAIEHHGFPISKAEAEAIFARLARQKPNQTLSLFFEDLQNCMASLPNPLPQVQWGKDLIKSVDKITRAQGTPLETLFRQLGAESVSELDVRAILSRYSPLSSAQWANLLPLLDKKPDGALPWQSILKWAGLDSGVTAPALPAPATPAPMPVHAVPAVPVPAPAMPVPVPAKPAMSPPPPTPSPPTIIRPSTMPAVPAPALPMPPGKSVMPPAPARPASSPSPPAPSPPGAMRSFSSFSSSSPAGVRPLSVSVPRPLTPVSTIPPPLPPSSSALGSHQVSPPPPAPPGGPLPPPPSAWTRS